MVLTVVPTVATDNLAVGVGVGVPTSMAIFARRAAHLLDVRRTVSPDGTAVTYRVAGELCFASGDELSGAFHHPDDPHHVVIDLQDAHVWDASAVSVLDALTVKYERQGRTVEIIGLDAQSSALHETLSGRLTAAH